MWVSRFGAATTHSKSSFLSFAESWKVCEPVIGRCSPWGLCSFLPFPTARSFLPSSSSRERVLSSFLLVLLGAWGLCPLLESFPSYILREIWDFGKDWSEEVRSTFSLRKYCFLYIYIHLGIFLHHMRSISSSTFRQIPRLCTVCTISFPSTGKPIVQWTKWELDLRAMFKIQIASDVHLEFYDA